MCPYRITKKKYVRRRKFLSGTVDRGRHEVVTGTEGDKIFLKTGVRNIGQFSASGQMEKPREVVGT